jgi:SAM-dependent methyltransferase
MQVLDVGCGVGGPAREMAKFTGANITGLNINEYQVQRASRYAEREGLAGQLRFVQGDFMVSGCICSAAAQFINGTLGNPTRGGHLSS